MKINRDIKDVLNDIDLMVKELSKLNTIQRLVDRKTWYDYDEFIYRLNNILDGVETDE